MEISYYKSKIGILAIRCLNSAVISLKITKHYSSPTIDTDFVKEVKKQLQEYFLGQQHKFDIQIKLSGTEF